MDPETSEAVQKTTEAAAAVERAREGQIHTANLESEERMLKSLTKTIKDAFNTDDDQGQRRFIDITRIPVICRDIATMHEDIAIIKGSIKNNTDDVTSIKDSMKWAVRIVVGSIILGIVAKVLPYFTNVIK